MRRGTAVVAISGCIAVAAALSLTAARAGTIDLWFDDSWVALSQRAPLSRALHMGVVPRDSRW